MVTGAHGELVAYGAFTVVPGHPKHVKREMDRMRERRATVLAQADYFQALAEWQEESEAERSGPVAVKAEPWSGPWTEGKVR